MHRTVTAHLEVDVTCDGAPVSVREIDGGHVHTLDAPAGHLVVDYLGRPGGLTPMDFHAVVEAWVDGGWRLVDATRLAPRSSLLRIATGRDAADTAFLTTHHGAVTLTQLTQTDVDPAQVVALR